MEINIELTDVIGQALPQLTGDERDMLIAWLDRNGGVKRWVTVDVNAALMGDERQGGG